MIKRFFHSLGVDYVQWLSLFKVTLKKDFRESSMSATFRHGRSGGRMFLTLIFYYTLTGLIFVPIVLSSGNVFLSGTLLITFTMFMIGSLILVEYHSVVISPDDYNVLGYLPVTSRTFFLVKIANIVFYVLIFTSVLALPAVLAITFVRGFRLILGMTTFMSAFLANFAVSLAIIFLYTFILKKMSLHKLQNAMAFFQVGLAFIVYSGFFIVPRLLENGGFELTRLAESPWFELIPSAWFASYLKIVLGEAALLDWLLALLSVAATAVLSYFAFSKLSIGYSEKLAALSSSAEKRKRSAMRVINPFLMFAKAHEERVVSKLIRNQFLYDNKFKMAVLGILPLTIFYLFIGVEEGPLPDPFVEPNFEMSRTGLLYLLVFLFPMMLRTYVTQSDAYQASWIFYTTPTDVRRVILSEKNFLMIYFVLPFLIILGCIFYFYFQNLLNVLLHLLALGLLAHLFLQFAFLYSPDLPFSRPNIKGSRSRNLALLLILVPFVIYLILPLIFSYVYTTAASYLTFIITILSVSLIVENLIQVRVDAHLKKTEFTG